MYIDAEGTGKFLYVWQSKTPIYIARAHREVFAVKVPPLFVFTGTSGSGRKTVAHRIGKTLGLHHVLSCTTRPPRAQEVEDRDYHYLTPDQFADEEARDGFVQTAEIDGIRYGTRRRDLEEALAEGRPVYLILNRFGTETIKQLYGDRVIRVFLYVDKRTVRERLEAKGTDYGIIERYLDHYTEEVMYRSACEVVVQNMHLDETLDKLQTILATHLD